MRFRLGVITGFAGGYYLGTKAGRERHEQINRALDRVRRSDAFQAATERTKAAVTDGVEVAKDKAEVARDKAQELVDSRLGNGQSDGTPLT